MIKLNLKKGTPVVIIANTSGHNRPIGTKTKINRYQGDQVYLEGFGNVYFLLADLKVSEFNASEINKEIKQAEILKKKIELKIKYTKSTKDGIFNNDGFRKFTIEEIIKNPKLSDSDKSKDIFDILC
jgi:hypothetical protein